MPRAQRGSAGALPAVLGLCLFLLVLQTGPAATLRMAAKDAVLPLQAAGSRLAGGFFEPLGHLGDAAAPRRQRDALANENAALRRQVEESRAAVSEDRDLRALLSLRQGFGPGVAAAVTARGNRDAFLTVDRGSADGVAGGMTVVAPGGLAGRVREVTAHAAFVQTLADPALRVNVRAAESGLQGTLSGGGRPLRLEVEARPGTTARPGEAVLTSGIGAAYPSGLLVGWIVTFDRRDSATVESAGVRPAADPDSVAWVLVLTGR